jgi:hypothetical protein
MEKLYKSSFLVFNNYPTYKPFSAAMYTGEELILRVVKASRILGSEILEHLALAGPSIVKKVSRDLKPTLSCVRGIVDTFWLPTFITGLQQASFSLRQRYRLLERKVDTNTTCDFVLCGSFRPESCRSLITISSGLGNNT